MAIGVIAKLKIQEGKNSEFEGIFQELAAAVRANEAGNNFYALHKSRSDPQLYIVLEQYVDQAALDVVTDHARRLHAQADISAYRPRSAFFGGQ